MPLESDPGASESIGNLYRRGKQFIANGAAVLATQVVNLFSLVPESTSFLERTPPVDQYAELRQWAAKEIASAAHPLLVSTLFSVSEERYERIVFSWSESSDYDRPRYTAHNPTWGSSSPLK